MQTIDEKTFSNLNTELQNHFWNLIGELYPEMMEHNVEEEIGMHFGYEDGKPYLALQDNEGTVFRTVYIALPLDTPSLCAQATAIFREFIKSNVLVHIGESNTDYSFFSFVPLAVKMPFNHKNVVLEVSRMPNHSYITIVGPDRTQHGCLREHEANLVNQLTHSVQRPAGFTPNC